MPNHCYLEPNTFYFDVCMAHIKIKGVKDLLKKVNEVNTTNFG